MNILDILAAYLPSVLPLRRKNQLGQSASRRDSVNRTAPTTSRTSASTNIDYPLKPIMFSETAGQLPSTIREHAAAAMSYATLAWSSRVTLPLSTTSANDCVRDADRRVLPALLLGFGVAMAAVWRGYEAQSPQWVGLGLLGVPAWTMVCAFAAERLAKRRTMGQP